MIINKEQFSRIFSKANADLWVDSLNLYLPRYDINTPYRIAAFLAQTGHESARFTVWKENLNYSADALLKLFKSRFAGVNVEAYARKPEKIANRIYSNRMGNGSEDSGDGWKYRGRGLIQLTGKENYSRFSNFLAEPEIVLNPDLLLEPKYALLSAVWYWHDKNLNVPADAQDIKRITKIINGGFIGLDDRIALYNSVIRNLKR